MYDENGNVNGNATATTNGSNGTNSAPSTPPAAPVAAATVVNGNATMANARRPNTFSPVSPTDAPQSFAYYNLNAQNGFVPQNSQLVNQQLNRVSLISHVMNVKDPTWLQVEVCREFQRGQCSRNDQECKFAHPLPHVEVQNGRVIACYDSLKNRCTRGASACKFLHPPQHLKEQVLNNGRNNFALKNYLMAQMSNTQAASFAPSIAAPNFGPLAPFAATVPTSAGAPIMSACGLTTYNPYAPCGLNATAVYPNVMIASSPDPFGTMNGILSAGAQTPMQLATIDQAQKSANIRYERMELQNGTAKRAVLEKGGAPVFQPVSNSVTGAMQCQPFMSAYPPFPTPYVPLAFTAPAPTVPRL